MEITLPNTNPFFDVNNWDDTLTTGETLKIVHTLWFSDYNAGPFMALLTDTPVKELQKMLKDSEAAEKSIIDKLKMAVGEWEVQAAQTLLLEKVLEYVRAPEVSHTSNEWKRRNPIGTYESDNEGYVYIDHELADGRYTIREIECADGYILDTQPKTIYVEYGGCTTITWPNTALRGQIQIIKKSAEYNSVNGLPAGTLLEGATFEIYNERKQQASFFTSTGLEKN